MLPCINHISLNLFHRQFYFICMIADYVDSSTVRPLFPHLSKFTILQMTFLLPSNFQCVTWVHRARCPSSITYYNVHSWSSEILYVDKSCSVQKVVMLLTEICCILKSQIRHHWLRLRDLYWAGIFSFFYFTSNKSG